MEKIYVSDRQFNILSIVVAKGEVSVEELASAINVTPHDIMRDLAELSAKELVVIEKSYRDKLVLSDEARKALVHGLPEEIVYRVAFRCTGRNVEEFLNCVSKEAEITIDWARIGLQYLIKGGCLRVEKGVVVRGDLNKCYSVLEEAGYLKALLEDIGKGVTVDSRYTKILRRRKFVKKERESIVVVKAAEKLRELWREDAISKAPLLTVVRPQHYITGQLEKAVIKRFDLSIPPPRKSIRRFNAYIEFLDMVREILVSMGFEEVKGPHVELELWNFDVLFQAQDHPAREIHDTFFLKTVFKGRIEDNKLVERARKIHEQGWGYRWSLEKALKPILRTQTTAVSARTIYLRGEGEYRCFTLDRVFRPETLDAKHSMEFYQLDGIIVGKNITFRDLLAFFREFAAALGIREVWFKPGYFPFTEPSVEGFIKHPTLGWIEVFPGGMFRPEVMEILGAPNVKAIAWGIGIDRLAMTVLGIDDIRDLFSRDLGFIEKLPDPRLPYFMKTTKAKDTIVVKYPI